MTTCYKHDGAPKRMCSWCEQLYCDADDHGHTREKCESFLTRVIAGAEFNLESLKRTRQKAQEGWARLEGRVRT